MAARSDPVHTEPMRQSLHHLVAKAPWNDEAILGPVRKHVRLPCGSRRSDFDRRCQDRAAGRRFVIQSRRAVAATLRATAHTARFDELLGNEAFMMTGISIGPGEC